MIKGIFFDFFNTLTYYHPSREKIYIDVCRKHGRNFKPKELAISLSKADLFWRDENKRSPIDKKGKLQQIAFYLEYFTKAVNGTGAKINTLIAMEILTSMRKIRWDFRIYEDALPAMRSFKAQGYIVGLISNIDKDIKETYKSLGLTDYLDFNVTSLEAGCEKPAAGIFQLALEKAKVKAEEAVYIGDQYHLDIIGAWNAGMQAILIDRNNWFEDIKDCPRIQTLNEVGQYIK